MSARAATIRVEGSQLVLALTPTASTIVFSPERARELAASLLVAAEEADASPEPVPVGEWDDLWPAFLAAERAQDEPEARRLRDELVLWHSVHGFPVPGWLTTPTHEHG